MLKQLFLTFIILQQFFLLKAITPINLIIDTDCAIDDFRTISFFLEDDRFSINAFIVSSGSVEVDNGINKLYSLLKYYNKDSIKIYVNRHTINLVPHWREFNNNLRWTKKHYTCKKEEKFQQIFSHLSNYKDKFIFIALGSLNSAATLLHNDEFKKRVDKIIWYNNSVEPKLSGFNYTCDSLSANYVLKQDFVKVDVISNLNPVILKFGDDLFSFVKNSKTKLSRNFYWVHNKSKVKKLINESHFVLHDELVYFYLIKPQLFLMNKSKQYKNVRYCEDMNAWGIYFLFKDVIKGLSINTEGVVLKTFPYEVINFDYDLRIYVDSIISKHGIDEWKSAILTNEIHNHLGIYSIIGVKMGMLARDYFKAKIDELEVYSFAGFLPPYSCINDGLQVSTGATLGRGTIHILESKPPLPKAIFIYNKNAILVELKNDIQNKIQYEISNAVAKFGLDDQSYWNYVRFLAIRYWYELSRNEIFLITPLSLENLKEYSIKY